MNNLDGIDVFVKVVQCGSFSGAARILGMPVTTVSGKVASLEKRLGITLIHRTTRKLSVTQAGDAFFKRCVRALEEVEAGKREIATTKSEPEGLLRITTPPDLGYSLLPPIIRTYLRTYPKMRAELLLTNRVVDLVGEGVDLAIRVGTLKDSSLIAKKFLDVQSALWASSSYVKKNGLPRHPKDLIQHDCITFKFTPEVFNLSNGRESLKVSIVPKIIVDDIEALKVFVVGGDGIGMIPSLICKSEVASGKIVRVLPAWELASPNIGVYFVYPPQRFVSPKIQSFIEMANRMQAQSSS
jgi:DNA-binding transcriptional LysR family regulator